MRRVSSGFSLIEVVFALAILAFAFFGMVSVITYSSRTNQVSRERNLAMRAAERKIEQMLSCTTFEDIYNKFSTQLEGQGWEQVQELDSTGVAQPALLPVALTVADRTMPSGYVYPDINPVGGNPIGVLYVRFNLNVSGLGGFDETTTDKFTGLPTPLDLDRDGVISNPNVLVANCKVLPVSIWVYWKSAGSQKTYLNYNYTFLRKTP